MYTGQLVPQARHKIGAITVGLKPDHVIVQQCIKNRLTPRQLLENVRRWEWDMQEESDLALTRHLPQVLGDQHQMIVMHPYEVFAVRGMPGSRSKLPIHSFVDFPVIGIEVAPRWHVVKQRPNDLVGEAPVELRNFVFGENNSLQLVGPAS